MTSIILYIETMREKKITSKEKKSIQIKVEEYYNLGKKMAEKYDGDYDTMVWNENNISDWYISYDSQLFKIAFDRGFHRQPIPVYAMGWRYGNIPETGCSMNHAENRAEPGVSMMEIK